MLILLHRANSMGVVMEQAAIAGVCGVSVQGYAVPGAVGHQMPLSFLRSGDVATIAKVRGKTDLHHHLENLGFVEGARVKVVSEVAGDLIVEVKGCQVALDRQVASRIVTAA